MNTILHLGLQSLEVHYNCLLQLQWLQLLITTAYDLCLKVHFCQGATHGRAECLGTGAPS